MRKFEATAVARSKKASLYAPATSSSAVAPRLSRFELSTSFLANAAASSLVKNSLPANSAGRSNGVSVALVHTPCRSGCPSGVRGAVHALAFEGLCAFTCTAVIVVAAAEQSKMRNRWLTEKPPFGSICDEAFDSIQESTSLVVDLAISLSIHLLCERNMDLCHLRRSIGHGPSTHAAT